MTALMTDIFQNFHFLRPLWLLALLPASLLLIGLWKQKRSARQWNRLIAADLLPFLVDGESGSINRWQLGVLLMAWTLAALALAGPVWEQRPMPVQKNDDALVLILDLSPSMLTEDVTPSRLIRSRLKIADILRERPDGLTALVVYAGDAHVVTPLTDDTATINSLLSALQPDIMPLPGSNTESAIEAAIQLLQESGNSQGHLLLITDGVAASAFDAIRQQLQKTAYGLSVLGVGGESPAPIPGGRGSFVRDSQNNIVTTRLNSSELSRLASQNNGTFSKLTNDNRDLERVLHNTSASADNSNAREDSFDGWYERGYWLVFLLLPVVLYCFRRGVVLLILCIPASLLHVPQAQAFGWSDLWLTKDQQAQRELEQGNAEDAAATFKNPDWKASAQYRAGNYEAAAEGFSEKDSARAHFNRGNALAKGGKLEDSIKAYDEALNRQPDFAEAQANRDLVQQLLDQQQEQDDQQNDDDQQEGENDNQSSDNNNEGDSDEQNQDQQDNPEDSDQSNDGNQSSSQANDDEQNADNSSSEPASEDEQQADESQQQSSDDANSEEQPSADPEEQNDAAEAEEQSAAVSEEDDLSDEQQQALEQWLRRVPDDPSGLLRNKFRYQYHQQQQQRLRGNWQVPGSADDERW